MSQALEALELANAVRIEGAKWRREVRQMTSADGRAALADALEEGDYPPHVGAMRLLHFLTAPERLGPGKASQICTRAGMWRSNPRVRDLTLRERARIVAELRRRADIARSAA